MRLSSKIALLIVFLACLFGITSATVTSWLMQQRLTTSQDHWTETLIHAISEGIARHTINGDILPVQAQLTSIISQDEALEYAYIIDFNDTIFAHSFSDGFPRFLTTLEHEQHSAQHQRVHLFNTTRGEILDISHPLIDGMSAHLHIGIHQQQVNALIRETESTTLLILVVVTLVGITLALLLGKKITDPLNHLSSWIRAYGKGNQQAELDIGYADLEVRELAASFNRMMKDREQLETSRIKSETRLQLLMNSTAEAIYGIDMQGNCTFANPACLTFLGYSENTELLDKNMHQLVQLKHEDGTTYLENESRIFKSYHENLKIHCENEVFWKKDGNSIKVEYWSHPVYEQQKCVGAVVTFMDITDRRKTEKALSRSQKMDAIGQLSGGISHDFNNQLGIIIGYLDILALHISKDKQASKWVDIATNATQRCIDLTRQLLSFSRDVPKTTSVVNVNELLSKMETIIKRSVTPEVEVQYFMAEDLWYTPLDSGEFQDCILNLVINARDAMPNGGKLLFESSNRHLDLDYTVVNPTVVPGDYVELMISDTGSGIPKKSMDHIFEPFYTTKPEGKGTGLGLAMVYGFVKRNNGYIKLYSEVGLGTTIKIYLPCGEDQPLSDEFTNSVADNLPTGNEKVLIVDDEAELLELASYHLSQLGYQTYTAQDAAQALVLLQQHEDIKLLFSDVVMPGGLNGYELAQKAIELRSDIKILLTSGFTSKTIAKNGLARFSSNLLGKPYRKEELATRVRDTLNHNNHA